MRMILPLVVVGVFALTSLNSCGSPDNAVDIELQVNQTQFRDRDRIELTVTFRARENTRVFLGERASETLKIFLRGGDGKEVDVEDTAYWWPQTTPPQSGVGNPLELLKGETHAIQIEGIVTVDRDSDNTEFDFGDFGTIVKAGKYQSLLIGVGFWPTERDSSDLLEHFSNDVWIEIER